MDQVTPTAFDEATARRLLRRMMFEERHLVQRPRKPKKFWGGGGAGLSITAQLAVIFDVVPVAAYTGTAADGTFRIRTGIAPASGGFEGENFGTAILLEEGTDDDEGYLVMPTPQSGETLGQYSLFVLPVLQDVSLKVDSVVEIFTVDGESIPRGPYGSEKPVAYGKYLQVGDELRAINTWVQGDDQILYHPSTRSLEWGGSECQPPS